MLSHSAGENRYASGEVHMFRLAHWMLLAALAASLGAQSLQFEVATVKPSPPLTMGSGSFRLGSRRAGSSMSYMHQSLKQLIMEAYAVKDFQISGPEWLASQQFDIEAKLPEGAAAEQIPDMLQSLLAERFGLKLHRESREHQVWALIVTKGGPKLTAADPPGPMTDEERKKQLSNLPPALADAMAQAQARMKEQAQAQAKYDAERSNGAAKAQPSKPRGSFNSRTTPNGGLLSGKGVTMAQVAERLTPFAGRLVVDATQLQGTFNIDIDLSPDEAQNGRPPMMRELTARMPPPNPGDAAAGRGGDPAGAPSNPLGGRGGDITGISLFQSIQRYGLKLESQKAPVDVLAIDHIEKVPTEN